DELVAALTTKEPADRPADAGAARALVHRVRTSLAEHDLARRADVPEEPPTPSSPETGDVQAEVTTAVWQTRTLALPVGSGPLTEDPDEPAPRRRVRGGRV